MDDGRNQDWRGVARAQWTGGGGVKVFIGFDPAEIRAHLVATASLHSCASERHDVRRVSMDELQAKRFYTRATRHMERGQLWDEVSQAPMSTGHAIARFFVPMLCGYEGWALFTDGDVLFRDDVAKLMDYADPKYAVCVVKHPPMPEADAKKDGHVQTQYHRKNWSSVMLFNCGHPSNLFLWKTSLNAWPGRDLHAFKWLRDDEIGELPPRFNVLVGVSATVDDPAIVHYTLGTPDVKGHEDDPFAEEWRQAAKRAGYTEVVPA
jgi:hypothetical protein